MFKLNFAFLIILISCTLFLSKYVQSIPSASKTDIAGEIDLLQKELDSNLPTNSSTQKSKPNESNIPKNRKTNESEKEKKQPDRVLTINKGMIVTGNIHSGSIKVEDLFIDGKVDITSLVTSEKIITQKLVTNSLVVEKIISADVRFN